MTKKLLKMQATSNLRIKTSATAQQVSTTILQQLGGNKFIAMTGSKNLIYGTNEKNEDFLQMHLTRNKANAKYLCISLNANDTYTVEFFTVTKDLERKEIKRMSGVYWDMLQDIFTEVTGLYTRL